jgi:acyl-CoA thioesterase FadM
MRTTQLGTTSFTVSVEVRIAGDDRIIVTVETVYVLMDASTLTKRPIPDAIRSALTTGAPDRTIDHAAYARA